MRFRTRPHRHRRRTTVAAVLLLVAAATTGILAGTGAPSASAAVHRAAPAASVPRASRTDVINYLRGLTGKSVISGQQDGPNSAPSTWQNKVHDITGVYPGIWGGDFAFEQNDIDARPTVIAQAKAEWAAGSIPALMWHVCPPTVGQSCHWNYGEGAIESKLTDQQWKDLVTDGTDLNKAWKARLDEVVPYLQQLKDAGIPVLWRPLHEMNEGWSWWGGHPGPDGTRKLYQITHDYLVKTKGLDNLVWVWNVKDVAGGASQISDYYPGDDYVDVVTLDSWVNDFPTDEYYQAIRNVANGKPIALAEVGKLPTPDELAAQPDWTYFSCWIDYLTSQNSDDEIKNTYYDGRVLHQGDISVG